MFTQCSLPWIQGTPGNPNLQTIQSQGVMLYSSLNGKRSTCCILIKARSKGRARRPEMSLIFSEDKWDIAAITAPKTFRLRCVSRLDRTTKTDWTVQHGMPFKGSWTPSKWTCQGWPFWWFGSIINNFLGFVGEKSRLFRDPVVDLARPSQPGEKLESGFTIPTIPTIATIPFIAPPAHPSFFFFLSLPCAVSPVIFRRSRATGDGNTQEGSSPWVSTEPSPPHPGKH